jgi:hypothetical protein
MPAQGATGSQSAATGGQPSDCSDKGVPSNVSYGNCAQQKVRATPPSQLPAHACGRLPDLADPDHVYSCCLLFPAGLGQVLRQQHQPILQADVRPVQRVGGASGRLSRGALSRLVLLLSRLMIFLITAIFVSAPQCRRSQIA